VWERRARRSETAGEEKCRKGSRGCRAGSCTEAEAEAAGVEEAAMSSGAAGRGSAAKAFVGVGGLWRELWGCGGCGLRVMAHFAGWEVVVCAGVVVARLLKSESARLVSKWKLESEISRSFCSWHSGCEMLRWVDVVGQGLNRWREHARWNGEM